MKIKFVSSLLIFAITAHIFGCTTNNKQQNDETETTLSGTEQKIPVRLERLDNDVFQYLMNPSPEKQELLKSMYGNLLEAFGSTAFNYSETNNPIFFEKLNAYFSNDALMKIYNDEQDILADISSITEELAKANFLISEEFKGKQLPTLSMHVSGFKENIIATDSAISISADKYLGRDYVVYKNFFENYMLDQMQTEMIGRDLLKAWLISEMANTNERKTLLSEMIYEGKILFALEELLPNRKETYLIGYTQDQSEWCYQNEKKIWLQTIQKKKLFSTDHAVINQYISEAPYTAPASTESPGSLGKWIGWQIVRQYAKNTGASLDDIMKESDSQYILKASKYNPK